MPKAKNLIYLRRKAKLSQAALAEALGTTEVTIRSWEHLKTAIPVPATKRVARFFDVPYSDFCNVDLERMDADMASAELHLTEQEAHSIIQFRKLDETSKQVFRELILALVAYMESQDG